MSALEKNSSDSLLSLGMTYQEKILKTCNIWQVIAQVFQDYQETCMFYQDLPRLNQNSEQRLIKASQESCRLYLPRRSKVFYSFQHGYMEHKKQCTTLRLGVPTQWRRKRGGSCPPPPPPPPTHTHTHFYTSEYDTYSYIFF